jgi:uncharacterized protein (TIGR03083 family)
MKPVEPILAVELFPLLSQELLTVLRVLHPTDWARPTTCSPWSVKDVAAHLLGGNFGRLWMRTEASMPRRIPDHDFDTLVRLIDSDNDLWVRAAQRISPEILIDLLDLTDRRLYDFFCSLDPFEPAGISVAWAGDRQSPNWFDIAREYTEKWLHQQHIREAVGQPLLLDRKWLFPVLDTFMRGLPHTYRCLEARDGLMVSIEITGAAGGVWTLLRESHGWRLLAGRDAKAACFVQIHQDLAWRLFTRGISRGDAEGQLKIEGNEALGGQLLDAVCIMA